MKPIFTLLTFLGLVLCGLGAHAQNITISGSCTQSLAVLEQGGDPLLTSINGRPVYYNAAVAVDYASSIVNTEAYLYYETAANLGTPEDRWVISFDGQPFYYFISVSMTAPTGTYLPFDPGAPVSLCGGSIMASPSTPLDVELISFHAVADGAKHSIRWTTASESNNDYFEVERSSDAVHFHVLGKVSSRAALGNSQTKLAYSFDDEQPLRGHNYYRLSQTDLNGKQQVVSAVIDVRSMNGNTYAVYPNPVVDKLTLYSPSEPNAPFTYEVRDLAGRMVVSGETANATTIIDVNGLPQGAYFLVLTATEQESQVFQFLKH